MDEIKNDAERLLIVEINGEDYCLPVSAVAGVIKVQRNTLFTLPYEPSGRIRGIFSHRGNLIAVAKREGLTARSDSDGSEELTAILLREQQSTFALLVDRTVAFADKSDALALSVGKLYRGYADERY